MVNVQHMNLGGAPDNVEELQRLKKQLVEVLEEIDSIRPIQFLDWENARVYNFLGLMERPDDHRIYICMSDRYDNLPAHKEEPLRDSQGHVMEPREVDGIL